MQIYMDNLCLPVTETGLFCMAFCMVLVVIFLLAHWMERKPIYTKRELTATTRVVKAFISGREYAMQERNEREYVLALAKSFQKLGIFPFSENMYRDYKELIFKLDKSVCAHGHGFGTFNTYDSTNDKHVRGRAMLPEDYYVQACIIQVAIIAVMIFLAFGVNFTCILGIAFTPFVPEIILRSLKKEMKQELIEIQAQFPTFVSMFYYRFRDKNTPLIMESLVDDFLPIANRAMVRLLVKFRTDLNGLGDLPALEQLTYRYIDCEYVTRFTGIAEGLYRRQDNAYSTLDFFHIELQAAREKNYREQDIVNEQRVEKAMITLYLELCVAFVVYLLTGLS